MTGRRGRWTYDHDPYEGPIWRLDGTSLFLEYDRTHSGCAIPGAWILYRGGHYDGPVDHYLDGAMEWVEEHAKAGSS